MESIGNCLVGGDNNPVESANFKSENSVLCSTLFLDSVGVVVLTLNPSSDQLYWHSVDPPDYDGSCCGLFSNSDSALKISDLYAVEFIDYGIMHESVLTNAAGGCLLGRPTEMYRFKVFGIQKSTTYPSVWAPSIYTFGHSDPQTCHMWVNRINSFLDMEADRPKNLLVFVHPKSGKGNGCTTWCAVAPIFSQANVKTKVTMTDRAGHAFDVLASITDRELNSYDGVIAVGGDGLFNEILNGLLLSRHRVPFPSQPMDFKCYVENGGNLSVHEAVGNAEDPSDPCEDDSPLLVNVGHNTQVSNLRSGADLCHTENDSEFSLPHTRFRFGIIPAGSTDATVICTTGNRDPVTSALQIVLGKRLSIDIAQVVRWKATPTSMDEPYVRYAANFAGYGFYGDVIKESEKYRWMGPKRYDYAGTKVFLQHMSYEAEVAYVQVESEKVSVGPERGPWSGKMKALMGLSEPSTEGTCRANCRVCNEEQLRPYKEELRWKKLKGHFLSVGAAVISCRNERAPDGLVADAHLSDGFLHLILVKNCPRALYLCHLSQLAIKGGNPLDFPFVEHHKTPAFMFTAIGKESVWNVDGEILQGHQLSAQVYRGLVSLFATGPD